jgi:SAM-dependent methyltransferase
MAFEKQVDKSHYDFARYMTKERWCSVWHQLDEIQKLDPASVLEVGPGPGLLKMAAACFGRRIETLDLDPELKPDHVGSITAMPFADGAYDVVCAFQVLEHFPYETSLDAFAEIARVANRHILISLPDAQSVWRYQFHLPKIGSLDFLVTRPRFALPIHLPDREHYWEINKRGYPLSRIIADLSRHMLLVKTYRVPENPYHRFFQFMRG